MKDNGHDWRGAVPNRVCARCKLSETYMHMYGDAECPMAKSPQRPKPEQNIFERPLRHGVFDHIAKQYARP